MLPFNALSSLVKYLSTYPKFQLMKLIKADSQIYITEIDLFSYIGPVWSAN